MLFVVILAALTSTDAFSTQNCRIIPYGSSRHQLLLIVLGQNLDSGLKKQIKDEKADDIFLLDREISVIPHQLPILLYIENPPAPVSSLSAERPVGTLA